MKHFIQYSKTYEMKPLILNFRFSFTISVMFCRLYEFFKTQTLNFYTSYRTLIIQ